MKVGIVFLFFLISNIAKANIFIVTDTGTVGANQLASYVVQANVNSDLDTIHFNIPGTPPYLLHDVGIFPITNPIYIDGFSQPGNDSINYYVMLRDIKFDFQSSHITCKGLKFIGGMKAISTFSADSLMDINILNNYFTGYANAIEFSFGIDALGINFKMESNIFINNTGSIFCDNQLIGSQYVNNYFHNGGLMKLMFLNFPNNTMLTYNTFDSTTLELFGIVHEVFVENNLFKEQSRIAINSSGVDSLFIRYNVFENQVLDNYMLLIFSTKDLYITDNIFDSLSTFTIEFDQSGLNHYLTNVFVSRNSFYNNVGFYMGLNTNQSVLNASNIHISNNLFYKDPILNIQQKIKFVYSGIYNSSLTNLSIDSNDLTGSVISFENLSSSPVNNLSISGNTIDSCANEPGISFLNTRDIHNGLYLNNNQISYCFKGIEIKDSAEFDSKLYTIRIHENYIHNNDSSGIQIMNIPEDWAEISYCTIDSNTIENNGADGITLNSFMHNHNWYNRMTEFVIRHNNILNNSAHGIHYVEQGTSIPGYMSPNIGLTYSANSIYSNGLKGIWIENINDPNFDITPIFPVPQIISLYDSVGTVEINCLLNGNSNTAYTIEFFGNQLPDSSGFGEGEMFIDSMVVNTNSSGQVYFQFNGQTTAPYYSCTAKNRNSKNTSVFSNAGDSTTRIQKYFEKQIRIFPNPVRDYCYINFDNDFFNRIISLYSVDGKVYEITCNSNPAKINLEFLPPGIYNIIYSGFLNSKARIIKL